MEDFQNCIIRGLKVGLNTGLNGATNFGVTDFYLNLSIKSFQNCFKILNS